MSEFDPAGSLQSALDQVDALARAASAAATVTATVEHDLVTVTLSAAPQLEAVDFPWASLRGVDAESLAQATRSAIAEAFVQVRDAQAEQLRGTPLASFVGASGAADGRIPPEMVARARDAAADLAAQEHTATDGDGRVEVTVDGVGTITRLWFSATAARESASEWLPEAVRSTVNAAFARARQAQEATLADGESADLERRLDEVVGAAEARLDGLFSRLDEVSRRLGRL